MVWNLKKLATKELNNISTNNSVDLSKVNLIRKLYIKYILLSGTIGSAAILFYYLPCDLLPDLFNFWIVKYVFFGINFEFFPLQRLYSVVCLLIEIYLLGILHINIVKKLSILTNFPNCEDDLILIHKQELIKISLENYSSNEKDIGLNPYYGLSKVYIYSLIFLNKIKAFLSNALIKVIIQKFIGRYVLRIYTDLISMPIYFFWNAYATKTVFLNTKYYIFSQKIINITTNYIYLKYGEKEEVKAILYELLSLIAIHKRTFSSSHYIFSIKLLHSFKVPVSKHYIISHSFIAHLKKMPDGIAQDLILLLITGMLIDGDLNNREINQINLIERELNRDFPIFKLYKNYITAFKKGEGENFLNENDLLM